MRTCHFGLDPESLWWLWVLRFMLLEISDHVGDDESKFLVIRPPC